MQEKENTRLNVDIRHHSVKPLAGSVNWYGDDYNSFTHTLDLVIIRLKKIVLNKKNFITVHMQDDALNSTTINEWKQSYCSEKQEEYDTEYRLMRKKGFIFLFNGLLILWTALSLVYLIDQIKTLHPYVQMLGRETLYFVGWVILWKPIEMIVFEPWLLKHQLKMIDKLNTIELDIKKA